jgi:hypothetical protein
MSSFFWLLFAHLLADYPLQSDFIATTKGKNNIILLTHAGIWTGVISLALVLLDIPFTALDVVLLFVVHTIADYLKARNVWFYKKLNPLGSGLLIDQSIHVLQILAVLYI